MFIFLNKVELDFMFYMKHLPKKKKRETCGAVFETFDLSLLVKLLSIGFAEQYNLSFPFHW